MTYSVEQLRDILDNAEMIVSPAEVRHALEHLAARINNHFSNEYPLVLSVMGGAVVFTGQLLPMLNFPLDFDYVHVTRYGDARQGGKVQWKVEPNENVAGRIVLVVDDILDEGETLAAIRARVMELGASVFHSVVFADKLIDKTKVSHADFVGLEVPDRFVFGYGMDVHGAWRNLPAIYAVSDETAHEA